MMMSKHNKYFKGTESYTSLEAALVAEFGQVHYQQKPVGLSKRDELTTVHPAMFDRTAEEQEPLLTEVFGELRPTTRPYTATECSCLEPIIESGIQISNGGLVHKDYCSTCELEVVGHE